MATYQTLTKSISQVDLAGTAYAVVFSNDELRADCARCLNLIRHNIDKRWRQLISGNFNLKSKDQRRTRDVGMVEQVGRNCTCIAGGPAA